MPARDRRINLSTDAPSEGRPGCRTPRYCALVEPADECPACRRLRECPPRGRGRAQNLLGPRQAARTLRRALRRLARRELRRLLAAELPEAVRLVVDSHLARRNGGPH
jgi:hypothetical protein